MADKKIMIFFQNSDIQSMKENIYERKVIFLASGSKFSLLFSAIISAILFFSCVTPPVQENCSRELLGKSIKNPNQLVNFFMNHKPNSDREKVSRLAEFYVEEGAIEGINSDVAFVQMCLETGFLGYGNLVLPEMNNFCGLGSMDAEHPGEYFESERIGVRAHIQHLQAYATTADVSLKQELVDPRYSWPHRTKLARSVFDLAGHWAMDPDYGVKLENLLSELEMCH